MPLETSETEQLQENRKNTDHILSIPLVGKQQSDRSPHSHERWLLTKLLGLAGSPPITFQLWNGETIYSESSQRPQFIIRLTDPKALYQLVGNPNLAFGDLYSSGRLDVEGDLVGLIAALYRSILEASESWPKWLEALWGNPSPRSTSLPEAKENIHHHYDLGNEFYRLWLDQAEMQYTCAYYESPDLTLEQAQLAKLEHVCRKLCLKPGQTVVEAGCGWGGLARYMAREYGVKVQAYNISKEQIAFARAEAKRQNLEDLVEYVEDDYRNIKGQYDAFVSVGMLEHVGKENYPEMAAVIDRVLKPGGMAMVHSIGRNRAMLMNAWIERRIFPGAYPPSISEFMTLCESGNFSVLDVENLRLHYARTLEHWLERFQQHEDKVTEMYDAHFTRAWHMYLAGSIAAFRIGTLQLFQVVFTRGDNNQIPRTVATFMNSLPRRWAADMEHYDVIIVGGGPAGATLAAGLKDTGKSILILDKQDFPRDKTCAGWVTPAVMESLGIDLEDYGRSRTLQPISGFRIGMMGQPAVDNEHGETVSYGIRRCEFDAYLLDRAGADKQLKTPVKTIERDGGQWIINNRLKTPLLVGAGGHFCPVAQKFGQGPGSHETVVAAKEIEFEMTEGQASACAVKGTRPELWFCRDLKGYAWVFRKGRYLNIGLGREDNHRLSEHLNQFVEDMQQQGRIPPDLPGRFKGHAYLLYAHAERPLVDDGVMLIGDAAGLAYTQSGEGIRPAIESALLAAEVIRRAPDASLRSLNRYGDAIAKRFGARALNNTAGWQIPDWVKMPLARTLMQSHWFTRKVVTEKWFLHQQVPRLELAV